MPLFFDYIFDISHCQQRVMSDLKSRPYRGVQKEDRIAQRREKLVDSAIQLFGSQGFANTSIKALCVNAGLTERSFYESFGVKEELLHAAYLHAREQLLQDVLAAALAAQPTPEARNLAAVSTYFRQLHVNPDRARLLLFELEGVSDAMNAVVREVLEESSQMILNVICKELPASPGKGLNATLLASGMMGAVYQLGKIWAHSGFKLPEEELVRNSHALFLGMIGLWEK
jgi:AcrR family transcriptional regulator